MPFDITNYLKGVQADDNTKAQAWEVYNNSANQKDFESKLGALGLPQNAKADMWESKYGGNTATAPTPQAITPPPAAHPQTFAQRHPILGQILGPVATGEESFGQGIGDRLKGAVQGAESYLSNMILPVTQSSRAYADKMANPGTPANADVAGGREVGSNLAALAEGEVLNRAMVGVPMGKLAEKAPRVAQVAQASAVAAGQAAAHGAGAIDTLKAGAIGAVAGAGGPETPTGTTLHVDPKFADELEAWHNDPDIQNKRVLVRTNKAGQQQLALMSHDGKVPRFAQTQASSNVLPEGQGEPINLSQISPDGKRGTAKPNQYLSFERPNKPASAPPTEANAPAPTPVAPETPAVPAPAVPVPAPETALPATEEPAKVIPQPEPAAEAPTPQPAIPETPAPQPEEGLKPGATPEPQPDLSPLEDKIRPLVGQTMRLGQLRQGEAVSHDIDRGINETNSMTGSIPSDVRGRLSNLLNEPVGDNLTPAQQARLEQMRGAEGSTTPVLKYAGKIADQELAKDPDAWQKRLDSSTIAMTQALQDPSTPPDLQAKLMKALVSVDKNTGEPKPYLFESDTLQYPRPQDLPADHPEAPFAKQAFGHEITPISLENYRAATGTTPRNLYNNPLGRKDYATPDEVQHLNSLKESVQTNGFNPDLLQDMLGVRGEDSEETTGTGRVMQARGSYSPEFEAANRDLQQKVLVRAHTDVTNRLKTLLGEWNGKRGQASTPLTEQLSRLPDSVRQHLPSELFDYEKSAAPETPQAAPESGGEQPAQVPEPTKASRKANAPGQVEGLATTKREAQVAKQYPEQFNNGNIDLIRDAVAQRMTDPAKRQPVYNKALTVFHEALKQDDPYALRKAMDTAAHNPESGYVALGSNAAGPLNPDQAHLANFDAAHNFLTRYEAMTPAELYRTQKALRSDTLARRIEAVEPVSQDPIVGAMQEDNYNYIKSRYEALVSQLPPSENLWTGLTKTVSNLFSDGDRRGEQWLRQQLGQRNHAAAQLKSQLQATNDFFTKVMNPADNDRFIDAMERGEQFDASHLQNLDQEALADWQKQYGNVPDFNQLAQTLRFHLDAARDRVQNSTGSLQDYITDYFPHMWDNVAAGQRVARDFTQSRTFMGNSDFLKQRTYEYRTEGLRQGLQPKTNSAVEDVINQVINMNHFVMTHDYLNKLVDEKQAQFFKQGEAIPEGWKPIKVNGRDMGNGEYAAPDTVARTFNNFTSKGLAGKWTLPGTDVSLFDKLRQFNGMNNMFQLGFSAFHATETLLNSAFTAQSIGLRQAINEGFKGNGVAMTKALLNAGKGYSFVAPIFEDAWNGSKGITAWKDAAGEAKFLQLASDLERANANVRTAPTFDIEQFQKMKDNWKQAMDTNLDKGTRGYAAMKAGGNMLASSVEAVSAPLMNYLIPRVKVGAFYRLADQIHSEYGGQHPDIITGELQKAWDSIDNRFGQVNYDNMFMPRATKDAMGLMMRSPGWNIGTFREVGGGVRDLGTSLKGATQGKGFQISNRTAYTAAMVTGTMLINAIYQYAHTGQMPTGVDYFFPKDGSKTASGEENRVYPKTYVYDAINFAHAPVDTVLHKAAPYISTLSDLYNNQDYYHREIRDPGAGFGSNVASTLGFMAKQFLPFSYGNYKESQMRGQKQSIGGAVGILPAPRWSGRTAAENLAYDYFKNTQATGPEDPVDLERKEAFIQMRNQLKSGQLTDDDIQKALDAGKITPKTVAHLYASKTDPNIVTWVKRLQSPEQVMNVWNAANDEEKKMLLPHLYSKIATETSGQEQQDYFDKLQEFADQMNKSGNPPSQ